MYIYACVHVRVRFSYTCVHYTCYSVQGFSVCLRDCSRVEFTHAIATGNPLVNSTSELTLLHTAFSQPALHAGCLSLARVAGVVEVKVASSLPTTYSGTVGNQVVWVGMVREGQLIHRSTRCSVGKGCVGKGCVVCKVHSHCLYYIHLHPHGTYLCMYNQDVVEPNCLYTCVVWCCVSVLRM